MNLHKTISYLKSSIRLIGLVILLYYNNIIIFGLFFIVAEILGIIEEVK